MQLSLWFAAEPSYQLSEIFFSSPLTGERMARRGKGLVYSDDNASFQWTAAVKAFALLVVGSRLKLASGSLEPFALQGKAKSAAASLDYAINKPTDWISGIFCAAGSRDRPRQIFKVSNSEQKLPGPVEIHLTKSLLSTRSLHVFIDDSEITSRDKLAKLYGALGGEKEPRSREKSRPLIHHPWYERPQFHESLVRESERALKDIELLEPLSINRAARRLERQKQFIGSLNLKKTIEQLRRWLPPVHQRYENHSPNKLRRTSSARLVQIACPPMALGAILLIRYATARLKIRLKLQLHYPSTSAIIQAANKEQVDFAVLSWGAVSKLSKAAAAHSSALMLLPRTSFEVIAPAALSSKAKYIYLATERAGYPFQCFSRLKKSGDPRFKGIKAREAGIAEIGSHIVAGKSLALVSHPFSEILTACLPCVIYESENEALRIGDNLLLQLSRKAPIEPQGLISALRSSWFELSEDAALLEKEITSLRTEPDYLAALKRLGGLVRFER